MISSTRNNLRASSAMALIATTVGLAMLPVNVQAACVVAAGVVTCSGPDTAANINAQITLEPGPDLNLVLPADAVITGGNVANSGGFTGAVTVTNSGSNEGIVFFGINTETANNFTIINNATGTSTGNLQINDAGGTSTIVNDGKITGGNVSAAGVGNSTVTAGVGSTANNYGASSAEGAATVSILGDANNDVEARGATAATVLVAGKANGVFAIANDLENTFKVSPVTAGDLKTTTTTSTNKSVGGDALVTITSKATPSSTGGNILANGFKSATINFDGKIVNGGTIRAESNGLESSSTSVVVTDKGKQISLGSTNTSKTTGGIATVNFGATGSTAVQASTIDATGFGGALITISGKSAGAANATSFGTVNSSSNSSTFDPVSGSITASADSSSVVATGGKADITIAAKGEAGDLNANGFAGATVTVNGAVDGNVSGVSRSLVEASITSRTNDLKGNSKETANRSSEFAGGTSTVTIASTGTVTGDVSSTSVGAATVANAGAVSGIVSVQSRDQATIIGNDFFPLGGSGLARTQITTNTATSGFTSTATTTGTTENSIGASASLTNAAPAPVAGKFGTFIGGTIAGPVRVTGLTSTSVANAGMINNSVTLEGRGTLSSAEVTNTDTSKSTALDGKSFAGGAKIETTNGFTSKSASSANGGTVDITNAAKAMISGTVGLTGNGKATVQNLGTLNGQLNVETKGQTTTGLANNLTTSSTTPYKGDDKSFGNAVVTTSAFNDALTSVDTGGAVSINNGVDAVINGTVNVNVVGGAASTVTLVNSGKMGSLNLNASGEDTSSASKSSGKTETVAFDGKSTKSGSLFSSSSASSNERSDKAIGSSVTLTNNKGAAIRGSAVLNGQSGASLINSGTVSSFSNVSSSAVTTSSSGAFTNSTIQVGIDPTDSKKGLRITQGSTEQSDSASKSVGGIASVVNNVDGVLSGGVSVSGTTGATIANSGSIIRSVFIGTQGNESSSTVRGLDLNEVTEPVDPANTKGGNKFTQTVSLARTDVSKDTGGDAGLTNAAVGSIGTRSSRADTTIQAQGKALVDNSGNIWGDINLNTNARSSSTTEQVDQTGTSTALDGKDTANGTATTIVSASKSSGTVVTGGGSATVSNRAVGLIAGRVDVNANNDISYDNAGVVYGDVNARAAGTTTVQTANSSSVNQSSTAVDPADLGKGTKTATSRQDARSENSKTTNGNVTASITGVNGVGVNNVGGIAVPTGLFSPASSASFTGSGNVSVDVKGSVFASVNLDAGRSGQTTTSTNSESNAETSTFDVVNRKNGTRSRSGTDAQTRTTRTDGGNATLTVSGEIRQGVSGGVPNVNVTAARDASVNVSGFVQGTVFATGGSANDTKSANTFDDTFVTTKDDERFDKGGSTRKSSSLTLAGKADVTLSGTARVGGVNASGTTTANVVIGAANIVTGSVNATVSNATEVANESATTYAYNASTKQFDRTETSSNSSKILASSSSATVRVDGEVGGFAEARALLGKATVLVNNRISGAVAFSGTNTATDLDKTTSQFASTNATSGGNRLSASTTRERTFTAGGDIASVIVRATDQQKLTGAPTIDNVTAIGFGGATIDIGLGTTAIGAVRAASDEFSNSSTITTATTTLTGASNTFSDVRKTTVVGGKADVLNNGNINGFVQALTVGPAATITNNGKMFGGGLVTAFGGNTTLTTIGTDLSVPATAKTVATTVTTIVGGNASFINNGQSTSTMTIQGANGLFVNNVGAADINVGASIANRTVVTTTSAGGSVTVDTPNALVQQVYKIDQNSLLMGNINVSGATSNFINPVTKVSEPIKTSNIAATINLASGSVTLGSISGQADTKTGASLTTTDVNLNGAGFLGYSRNATGVDQVGLNTAQKAFFSVLRGTNSLIEDSAVTSSIRGVRNVLHSGAGTFYMVGDGFNDGNDVNPLNDQYDIKAVSVTNTGGRLALSTRDNTKQFSISGNVTNSAELLFGTSFPQPAPENLGSITSVQTDVFYRLQAARIDGNLTQTATGTMFAVATPDLLRRNLTLATTTVSELLGYADYQLNRGAFFFDKPNPQMLPRSTIVTVNGNLDLKGTLATQVNRGSVYLDGTSIPIFNVSGTVSLGAVVAPLSPSGSIGFELTQSKVGAINVVSLTTKRKSFSSIAGDTDNSRSAGVALDSAVISTFNDIKNDSLGSNVFPTVERFRQVQDVANIVTAFDWYLTKQDANAALNELGSGEFYASLSSLGTTSSLSEAMMGPTNNAIASRDAALQFWAAPVYKSSTFEGSASVGASRVEVSEYGVSLGARVQASQSFSFGVAGGFRASDVTAKTRPVTGDVETYMAGGDVQYAMGPWKFSGQYTWGSSTYDTVRQLPTFARVAKANFDGTEQTFRGEVAFDLTGMLSGTISPYVAITGRSTKIDEFTELSGGGINLQVDAIDNSYSLPEVGVRWGSGSVDVGALKIMPFARLSYIFSSDEETTSRQRMTGGGNSFLVRGVDVGGYGTLATGLDTRLGNSGSFSLGVGGDFGARSSGFVSTRFALEF